MTGGAMSGSPNLKKKSKNLSSPPPPLPDELIEELRQIQGDTEARQWVVGDFLVGVVDELGSQYERIGVRHARAWLLSHMAARIGCDPSTLRDRECMARFFPAAVREEYPFMWSQWRALKSAGENWREHAEYWAVNLPAPVAAIRERVKSGGAVRAEPWEARWERVQELAEQIKNDQAADVRARRLCGWLLRLIDQQFT
jgi:hypothetical protein